MRGLSKTGTILIKVFLVANTLVFAFLFLYSFRYIYINTILDVEFPTIKGNSPVVNGLGVLTVLVIFFLLGRIRDPGKKLSDVIALFIALLSVFLNVIWIHSSATIPAGDQALICAAASAFNHGDYTMLEKGQYLATCPQNIGVTTVLRIIFILFGEWNETAFKMLSAFFILPLVYGIYRITVMLSEENKIGLIAALATFACIPMYFYTTFIYGEIMSISLSVCAIMFFMKTLDKPGLLNIILLFLSVFGAVFIKSNSLIIIIAMIVVCMLKLIFSEGKKRVLFILFVLIAGMILPHAFSKLIYMGHMPADAKGIPAILYIQMGVNRNQVSGLYGFGWYDDSVQDIYRECDYSVDEASLKAREMIGDFFSEYKNDIPGLVNFYKIKITSQWNNPMYQAMVMNNRCLWENQNAFAQRVYNDQFIWKIMDKYMNIYQLMIYLGAVLSGIRLFIKCRDAGRLTCLIAVFGGFLFSVIWEAKGRYIFPYLMLLIPDAITGLYIFTHKVKNPWKQKQYTNLQKQ